MYEVLSYRLWWVSRCRYHGGVSLLCMRTTCCWVGCSGFRFQLRQIRNLTIFGNPAKSGSGQFFSRICPLPVQLEYIQLITEAADAADLSSNLFAVFISVTRKKKNTIFVVIPQISSKLANSDVTKEALNCTASLYYIALLTPLV